MPTNAAEIHPERYGVLPLKAKPGDTAKGSIFCGIGGFRLHEISEGGTSKPSARRELVEPTMTNRTNQVTGAAPSYTQCYYQHQTARTKLESDPTFALLYHKSIYLSVYMYDPLISEPFNHMAP